MRNLNQREKILLLLVGTTAVIGMTLLLRKKMNDHLAALTSELVLLQQKLQIETQIAQGTRVSSPVALESDLLRTLNLVPNTTRLSIQRLDRSSETTFKLALTGAFQDVMPVISRFESDKNIFQILRIEIKRPEAVANTPLERRVEAVLYLQRRKGTG